MTSQGITTDRIAIRTGKLVNLLIPILNHCHCKSLTAPMFRRFVTLALLCLVASATYAQVTAPDFSIVVLPDPQNATQYYPAVLNSQAKWIVDNQKALN